MVERLLENQKLKLTTFVSVAVFMLTGTAWLIGGQHGMRADFKQEVHKLRLEVFETNAKLREFIAQGPRYTPTMAKADAVTLKDTILDEIEEHYPPQWLRDLVQSLARRVESLERG